MLGSAKGSADGWGGGSYLREEGSVGRKPRRMKKAPVLGGLGGGLGLAVRESPGTPGVELVLQVFAGFDCPVHIVSPANPSLATVAGDELNLAEFVLEDVVRTHRRVPVECDCCSPSTYRRFQRSRKDLRQRNDP